MKLPRDLVSAPQRESGLPFKILQKGKCLCNERLMLCPLFAKMVNKRFPLILWGVSLVDFA
jgi:hypothetical protein